MSISANITIEEMRHHLKPEKGWVENLCGSEAVFVYEVKSCPGIVIKVFSSINPNTGKSRKKGADAIRVCAVDTVADKGFVKMPRVHRTTNWRDNLKQRVIDCINKTKNRYHKPLF